MSESSNRRSGASVFRMTVAVVAVFAVVAAFAVLAFSGAAVNANAHLRPAGGSSEQWAFGGIASGSYHCVDASCFGGNLTNGSISLSFQYYIEWVVIFTQTNISSNQTMIESQAALNASAQYSLSACIQNGTAPCKSESVSLTLNGKETALGFTNITNAGSVNMTAPASGSTPALAIINAASQQSFNFSGSYSLSGPFGPDNTTVSANANFDFGANEQSSVSFANPLGIVPLNPQPGDAWNSSAPFSATGSWTSGYSFAGTGYNGEGGSASNWTSGAVTPSGVLFVNGTDLGQYTLYDNYTHPPTQVTAQLIALDFNNGTFEAADGWIMIPFGMYGGVLYGLGGLAISHGSTGPVALAHPAASPIGAPTGESAYYERGPGIVGAGASGSTSGLSGTAGPSVQITAGPEPVSVAQKQYAAVTSSKASSSSGGFPVLGTIVVIVVVVVIVALVAIVLYTRRRRQAASMGTPPAAASVSGPSGPMSPMSPAPAGIAAPATLPPPMSAPPAPVCPHCGQPGTYIAQYGRYYCYTDKQYL
jgi:hypothetical protein